MAAAKAFLNLKSNKSSDETILKASCKQVGLMRLSAMKRLTKIYLEVVQRGRSIKIAAGSNGR
jgi:hypothetical protein